MRVLRLYKGLKFVLEIPYTQECLAQVNWAEYTHWKVVWVAERKPILDANSVMGVFQNESE